jgi:signal transduction histidine kinase
MINYNQRKYWNAVILILAVFISIGTLVYTRILVKSLAAEEYKLMNLLGGAYKELNEVVDNPVSTDISFLFTIIKSNENVPLILTDAKDQILESRNLDSSRISKKGYLERQLEIMKSQHPPIPIIFSDNQRQYIYYKDSKLIVLLRIYPYVQLFFVILFILIAYFAFNSSRKFEQNKVWVGMSKETAHQLGTPVSSLIALSENLKEYENQIGKEMIEEFEKDIFRLQIITERFSKIGSLPKFENRNIYELVNISIDYLRPRLSKKVSLEFSSDTDKNVEAQVIPSLFDWVIENISKNAINAMEGAGKITFSIRTKDNYVCIDISDTGKGIPRNKYHTIFNPGYTTSARGWGMGLSLTKRIIERYHDGQIFVKSSDLGKGSTFRIKLPRKKN